jgi:hypothetical protein
MLKRNIIQEKILHGLERNRSNFTKTIAPHTIADMMYRSMSLAIIEPPQAASDRRIGLETT